MSHLTISATTGVSAGASRLEALECMAVTDGSVALARKAVHIHASAQR